MDQRYPLLGIYIVSCLLSPLFVMSFSGCATAHKEQKIVSVKEDILFETKEEPVKKNTGSLWQDNGSLSELFYDHKARKVGDIVTIRIVESSDASNNADTNTSKNSSTSMNIAALLGLENNDTFPRGSGFDPFGFITSTTNNTFKGSGTTNRSGNLAASITARVTEVLPNGNMKIIGKRQITINNEEQYIALSGIIRSRDISSDNVILSTYISDAKIIYTGTGVINDRQSPGWLARIVDSVWPF